MEERREVDGVEVVGSLSPTRAADFTSCALRFRFRTVDRLPEPSTPQQVRGTVVHRVLEEVFDLPAERRTPLAAAALVRPVWEALREQDPTWDELFVAAGSAGPDAVDPAELHDWLLSCQDVLATWFDLEDPRRLEPAERERFVEDVLESRVLLRGIIDRVDVAPDAQVRLTDYKTGRSPKEGFEAAALFQLRFYALVWWRTTGVVPSLVQLVYLGDGQVVSHAPDEHELEATRRKVDAIWEAVAEARRTETWLPSRGRHCDWCSFKALCPAWGGTPPPVPVREPSTAEVAGVPEDG